MTAPRVGLVTNFCPHYRRPLFAELGRRMDLTLLLTSRGSEWYWQQDPSYDTGGVPSVRASTAGKMRRELRAGRYDAVVGSLTGRATLLAAFWTARELSIPFVLWVGIWEHPRTLAHRCSRLLVRRLYRSADAVVTYGTHVSEYVHRESGRADGVFVARQSVDNERFRRAIPEADVALLRDRLGLTEAPTFTYVGRLTEEKGLATLLEASARAGTAYELVLAGSGPLRGELERQAASLGLDGRVAFAGHVDQADLPVLLRASDALVLPSVTTRRMREPWGLVVNEAMNCGLPVIATDAVGAAAAGLVVDGETGLVVPERDAESLARAIDRLVSDAEERRRLGRAGSERVLSWNYSAAAEAFESALAYAMSGRSA